MRRTEQGKELYELGLRLGALGQVAIGASGGELALALARCVGCGVALAGGEANFHDGSCVACGIWLARYYGMAAAVFLRQQGGSVSVHLADEKGKTFTPKARERLSPCTGRWDLLTGADSGWAARRVHGMRCDMTVAAEGTPALRLLLERMGCQVLDRPQRGVPLLRTDEDGFRLTVENDGMTILPPGKDALSAAVAWLSEGRAVPAFGAGLL